jgi:hypothetical protein
MAHVWERRRGERCRHPGLRHHPELRRNQDGRAVGDADVSARPREVRCLFPGSVVILSVELRLTRMPGIRMSRIPPYIEPEQLIALRRCASSSPPVGL